MTKHLTDELVVSGQQFRSLMATMIATLDEHEGVIGDDTIDEVIKVAQLYQAASLFWREDSALRYRAAENCQGIMEGLAGLTPDGSSAVSNVQTLTSDFLTRDVALPHWGKLIASVGEAAGRVSGATDRRQKLGFRHELELALFDLEEAFTGGSGSLEAAEAPVVEEVPAPEAPASEGGDDAPVEATPATPEETADLPAVAATEATSEETKQDEENAEGAWDSSLFEGLDMETGDLIEREGLDMLDMDIGD